MPSVRAMCAQVLWAVILQHGVLSGFERVSLAQGCMESVVQTVGGLSGARRLWASLLNSHAADGVTLQWLPVLACWLTSAAGSFLAENGSREQERPGRLESAERVAHRTQGEGRSPRKHAEAGSRPSDRNQDARAGQCHCLMKHFFLGCHTAEVNKHKSLVQLS
jgi:hypothetical protein